MTNYDKICQASRQLSNAEQIKVLQYIESLQNGDGDVDRTASDEPKTSSKENQVHYINRYNALFALAFRAKESISNIIDSILHGIDTDSFSYWDVKNSALVNL